MVLLRLQPDQVSRYWDILRFAISVSIPPITRITDRFYVKCLEMILAGKMQAWVQLEKVTAVRIKAVVITELIADPIGGEKSLLLFAGTTFVTDSSIKDWKKGLDSLRLFAKANKCTSISAYSANPHFITMLKRIGFVAEYTFATVDLANPL